MIVTSNPAATVTPIVTTSASAGFRGVVPDGDLRMLAMGLWVVACVGLGMRVML